MAKLYTDGYLEYTAPDGRHWRIWPDGAHLVVPRLEDVQTGALVTLAARDLAAEFYKAQQQLAEARQENRLLLDQLRNTGQLAADRLRENNQARALLERWRLYGLDDQLYYETQAFLAESEQGDGK